MSAWMSELRSCVNARLERFLEEKYEEARELSPESLELVASVRDLTMRGGKRLRAGVIAAGFCAASGKSEFSKIVDVCAAIELLQSYLLIHDDWMDGDDERRGGPSVHAALSKHHKDPHLGAAVAVLAGDLAAAYAWELFHAAPFPSGSEKDAIDTFLAIHKEVFFGQHLDLIASQDVARVHRLKTDSYTVRGPVLLGAILGGAGAEQRAGLVQVAEPLGLAFQLRDDILGTFGESKQTGKPAGNDLRAGKRTALISEMENDAKHTDHSAVLEVFGKADAPQDAVEKAMGFLESIGAKGRVEAKLEACTAQAYKALGALSLSEEGDRMLRDVAELLTHRNH